MKDKTQKTKDAQMALTVLRVFQFLGPGILLVFAVLFMVPDMFFRGNDPTRYIVSGILTLLAPVEFFILRYVIIPPIQKQVNKEKQIQSNSGSAY